MQERTADERERTTYRNHVQQLNQALATAHHVATQADTRRIRAETATEIIRQELKQACAERQTTTPRRELVEETVDELTCERDSAVYASEGVQAIREHFEEANEDVERLTNNVKDL